MHIYTCILVYLHKIRILNSSKGQIVGKITYFTQLSINSNLISIFYKVVMYTIMHYFLHQSWQNYYRYIPTILPSMFPPLFEKYPCTCTPKNKRGVNFYSLSFRHVQLLKMRIKTPNFPDFHFPQCKAWLREKNS